MENALAQISNAAMGVCFFTNRIFPAGGHSASPLEFIFFDISEYLS
jgi:hypothetical protein